MKKILISGTVAVVVALGATGCASFTEEWNDAPVERKNDAPAVVGSMPDGFANWAEKCDDSGNLIATTKDGNGGGKVVTMLHLPQICPKAGPPLTLPQVPR
ncbi:hypothetical protein [Streptomyces roseolus]|uniref:hypothetical protein n=1 Tax=Streptomyces roseolus TaxID=67358 RepID=UPI00167808C7|nr:hypothetical protein [Streptomyces roseolus]GGR51361.1 hypothetical protein GCM10010282_50320 [Streptomyces roseolus]